MKTDRIVLFPESHTYWLGNDQLPSAGSLIAPFEYGFDNDYWIVHKTIKNLAGGADSDYMKHFASFHSPRPPVDELFPPWIEKFPADLYLREYRAEAARWKRKSLESAYFGTVFHENEERLAYEAGFKINPFDGKKYPVVTFEKIYPNESQFLDMSLLEDGLHLELIIFDLERGLAGMADEVYIETIDGVRYFDIDDHKTNENKPTVNKNNVPRGEETPNGMKPPLQHLKESSHNYYGLKISTYAYMLELHGFTARNLSYTWYKNYDRTTGKQVKLKYFREEIDEIYNMGY